MTSSTIDRPAVGVAHARFANLDRTVLEHDAVQQLLDGGPRDDAVHLGDVRLLHLVRRVRHLLREVTVVGEQDQAVGVGVEAAHVEEPLRTIGDELGQRAIGVRVRHRRGDPGRLVQHEVDVRADRRQPAPLDADHCRGRVDLGAEPGDDLAVDLHQPGEHQLLALATAGHAGLREELLQTDQPLVVGLDLPHSSMLSDATSSVASGAVGTSAATSCSSSKSSTPGRNGASSGRSSSEVTPMRSRK